MKKMLMLLLCIPFLSEAQVPVLSGKNIVKLNLSSLVAKNFHITYERKIAGRISASLGFRTMAKGSLPFKSTFESLLDGTDFNFNKFELGNTAFTPEVRLYLGKGNLRGFYVAPYMRFASFDVTAPIKYTYNNGSGNVTEEAPVSGKIKSTSAGIMFGTQYRIFKVLTLDIWIIGGHYGSSKGDLSLIKSFPTQQERDALQQEINSLDAKPFKFKGTVTSTGAFVQSDGPWAGVRGLGVNIGFRF
ncbi:MAG: DUF3575 domain-containing protein [Chitinophagaceae bacterium]|nr:DUF3575 domain-containing protein [Chitinophagaceae bacterium]